MMFDLLLTLLASLVRLFFILTRIFLIITVHLNVYVHHTRGGWQDENSVKVSCLLTGPSCPPFHHLPAQVAKAPPLLNSSLLRVEEK